MQEMKGILAILQEKELKEQKNEGLSRMGGDKREQDRSEQQRREQERREQERR